VQRWQGRHTGGHAAATLVALTALLLGAGCGAERVAPAPSTAPESGAAAVGACRPSAGGGLRRPDGLPRPLVPLAAGNPFTTPLPVRVPLQASRRQRAFRRELAAIADHRVTVEQGRFSSSLYLVYRNGDVRDSARRLRASRVRFVRPRGPFTALNAGIDGRGWPIAGWMQPDPGEGHMALYNPETGTYGEFYGARVRARKVRYRFGGLIRDARRSRGEWSEPRLWGGATASGATLMSVTISEHEIRRAVARYQAGDHGRAYIPHLLGFEAYRHHPNQWHYPATKTDDVGGAVPRWGVGGDRDRLGNGRGILRMGGIMRVAPSVHVLTQVRGDGTPFGDMMARIVARTLQRHGATMTDQTNAGFALLAEHVRDPGGGIDAGAFDYGAGEDGAPWLEALLRQLVDNRWVQWVATGRSLEADTGRVPSERVYRPRC
jgi:hypothetical protein